MPCPNGDLHPSHAAGASHAVANTTSPRRNGLALRPLAHMSLIEGVKFSQSNASGNFAPNWIACLNPRRQVFPESPREIPRYFRCATMYLLTACGTALEQPAPSTLKLP